MGFRSDVPSPTRRLNHPFRPTRDPQTRLLVFLQESGLDRGQLTQPRPSGQRAPPPEERVADEQPETCREQPFPGARAPLPIGTVTFFPFARTASVQPRRTAVGGRHGRPSFWRKQHKGL
jgi:hypothetical protein